MAVARALSRRPLHPRAAAAGRAAPRRAPGPRCSSAATLSGRTELRFLLRRAQRRRERRTSPASTFPALLAASRGSRALSTTPAFWYRDFSVGNLLVRRRSGRRSRHRSRRPSTGAHGRARHARRAPCATLPACRSSARRIARPCSRPTSAAPGACRHGPGWSTRSPPRLPRPPPVEAAAAGRARARDAPGSPARVPLPHPEAGRRSLRARQIVWDALSDQPHSHAKPARARAGCAWPTCPTT